MSRPSPIRRERKMDPRAIAIDVLMEAINRALTARQVRAIQQQQIVTAEELLERMEAQKMPEEQIKAAQEVLEAQRLQLSEMRRSLE